MVVASVMSVALSASIFPEEKAEMREVKPIFSDAGISTIARSQIPSERIKSLFYLYLRVAALALPLARIL